MARPPSVRRPTLEVFAREVDRIKRKQERALKRLDKAVKESWPSEDVEQLEEKAALNETDRQTLVDAAKAAAMLEKTKETEEDDPRAPKSEAEKKAALERLERVTETEAPRLGGEDDEPA